MKIQEFLSIQRLPSVETVQCWVFDDVEGKGTKRTVLAVSLSQSKMTCITKLVLAREVALQVHPSSDHQVFDEKLEFVSPENPNAQNAVLSIKVIKTMARRVSHQYPDAYRTLSGDRQAGFCSREQYGVT